MYPRVEINLRKIEENTRRLVEAFQAKGISLMAVTKGFGADKRIALAMLKGNPAFLADARIRNLRHLRDFPVEKVLLRLPMVSEVEEVVRYADYSLNSEIETLRAIGAAAERVGTRHKVIIMVDLGDYREGIRTHRVEDFCREAVTIQGIDIRGFGVNLTCYGGVIPEHDNLKRLVDIARRMQETFGLRLDILSGGSSSSVHLLDTPAGIPQGINNLRLGEVILLGRETAYGKRFKNLHTDAFILKAQIIEVKDKPSVPRGKIGMDAFGNVPHHEDRGIIRRAILALGKQDVDPENIRPRDKDLAILGASSDHLIVDLSHARREYRVGDIMEFHLAYGGMLHAMTSPYVDKFFLEETDAPAEVVAENH